MTPLPPPTPLPLPKAEKLAAKIVEALAPYCESFLAVADDLRVDQHPLAQGDVIAGLGHTEEEIFAALGLEFVPPERRER